MLEGMLARSRDQLLSLDFLGPALLGMKELIPINPNQERGYRITIDRLLQKGILTSAAETVRQNLFNG